MSTVADSTITDVHYYPSIFINGHGDISKALTVAHKIAQDITSPSRIEIIEPEQDKKSISIDQARALRKKVSLKSKETSQRVFIISDIALMGDEAQNTLLKTLEELGDNNTIISVATSSNGALPTILSRSRIISVDNNLDTSKSKKQYLIDSAEFGFDAVVHVSENDLQDAVEFMRYSVSDRLYHYQSRSDDRDAVMKLLLGLRVLCISTMRETLSQDSKKAWSKKVIVINDILKKAHSNTSTKLLILGAAIRL